MNSQGKLLFRCPVQDCGKLFKTRFSLKRHILVHSNTKNFQCPYCPKRFSISQYLREHIYSHTKEEPLVCGVNGCQKKFRQAGKLSLHRRMHKEYPKKRYDYSLNGHKSQKRGQAIKDELKNVSSEDLFKIVDSVEGETVDLETKKAKLENGSQVGIPDNLHQDSIQNECETPMKPTSFSFYQISQNHQGHFFDINTFSSKEQGPKSDLLNQENMNKISPEIGTNHTFTTYYPNNFGWQLQPTVLNSYYPQTWRTSYYGGLFPGYQPYFMPIYQNTNNRSYQF